MFLEEAGPVREARCCAWSRHPFALRLQDVPVQQWAEVRVCAMEQCSLCTLFPEQNESSLLWVPNPAPSGL